MWISAPNEILAVLIPDQHDVIAQPKRFWVPADQPDVAKALANHHGGIVEKYARVKDDE